MITIIKFDMLLVKHEFYTYSSINLSVPNI